jgi:hypothetical protein
MPAEVLICRSAVMLGDPSDKLYGEPNAVRQGVRSRKSRETSAGRLDKLRDVARGAAAQNQHAGRNSKQILDAV